MELAKTFRRFYLYLVSKKNEICLFAFILVYFAVISYLSLIKYYTFHATAWDLGVFSQSLYTTINFRTIFYNNLEIGSHFHVHFSPILFLFVPFYALYQSPVTLIILQAIIVALGGIPLYFLAKNELGNTKHSLAFTALYFLYPVLHASNLYDFHPEAFIPLLGFSAIYFLKNNKWSKYFACILLLLSVKEDASLVVVGIGLYGLFRNIKSIFKRKIDKNTVISLLTVFIGIAGLLFAFYMISYFVTLDGYGSLWNQGYAHHTQNVYGELGGSEGLMGLLSFLIRNPLKILSQLSYLPSQKIVFIATLFLPLCMFAFLDIPSILLFFPNLLELMLASNPNYFAITYHYPLLLIPTIFVAVIHGVRRLAFKCGQISEKDWVISRILFIMMIATLITLLFTTPIIMQNIPMTLDENTQAKHRLISLIPLSTNPYVLTQNDYFPHVSNSLHSYAYWNTTAVEYLLFDIFSYWFDHQDPVPDEYIARYGEPEAPFEERISRYVDSGEFGLLAQAGSLLLYKKGYKGELSFYFPLKMSINWRDTLPTEWKKLYFEGIIVDDPTSMSQKVLMYKANSTKKEPSFWYGPYIWLPPGAYEVKFRLKITNITNQEILILDVTKNFGKEVLAKRTLTGGDFSEANVWQEFVLSFQLKKLSSLMEFRGFIASNATDVYLDYILVQQIPPFN
ncbi:MAG: DUF2079 domain-containing protein [Candidatus Bathyarchaeia archaeon]